MYTMALAFVRRQSAQNSRRENRRAKMTVPDDAKVAGICANLTGGISLSPKLYY
jgi:hypothetical protein